MQIGKAGPATTSICDAQADRIEVRGRDLTSRPDGPDRLHRIFLPAADRPRGDRGAALLPRPPAGGHRRARPDADRAGGAHDARRRSRIAAGRGGGRHSGRRPGDPRHVGSSAAGCWTEARRRRSRQAASRMRSALALVRDIRERAARCRASATRSTSRSIRAPSASWSLPTSAASPARMSTWRGAFATAVAEVWGKPLVMNVSMPIAAVLLDLDFPAAMIKAIPLLARTAGLLAHLAEEQQNPIGFLMAAHGEAAVAYRRQGGPAMMLEPEVETRPGPSSALPTTSASAARSPISSNTRRFYREKLRRPAFRPPEAVGGLDRIAALPFTEKERDPRKLHGREPDRHASRRHRSTKSCASSPPAARPARRATFR